MKKSISICLLLLAVLTQGGCNQEDDINEIFVSGVWNLNNYYSNADWNSNNDRNARAKYTNPDDLKIINRFTIEFKEDGTLSGVMENKVSFTGKWSANPDDRSISITQLKPASSALKGRNQEFIRSLETARFYKGNSQWIQLAPEARTTYVQLTHIKP